MKNQYLNNTQLITKIKNSGYRGPFITHFRRSLSKNALLPLEYFKITGMQKDIDPKGGLTIVKIQKHDHTFVTSIAECSDKDSFKTKLGTSLALTRIKEHLVLN